MRRVVMLEADRFGLLEARKVANLAIAQNPPEWKVRALLQVALTLDSLLEQYDVAEEVLS